MPREDEPNSWKKVQIKDLYLGLYDGPHATPKPSTSGPVFLGIKNITEDGRLDLSQIRNISEEDFPKWTKRVLPRAEDIVFSYEATLNLYAMIPEGFRGCLGRRLALIRPDTKVVDPKFLYCSFFGEEWRNVIFKNLISGATVDRIPLINFPNFEISLPSLLVQKKISSILSSYDDLIENNTRRIEILEQMAKLIYEEWFVKFRFPGHENVKMVSSDLGEIPEGWKVKKLADVCSKISSGGTPARKNSDFWDEGNILWFKTKELTDGYLFQSEEMITEKGLKNSSAKLFPKGTIAMAIYAAPTVGRLGILTEPSTFNQAACGLVPNTDILTTSFLFLKLLEMRNYFNSLAQGAAQQNINLSKVSEAKIIVPTVKLVKTFDDLVGKIMDEIQILSAKNQNLCKTRDLLLPKLISGEIDISDLDIRIRNEFQES